MAWLWQSKQSLSEKEPVICDLSGDPKTPNQMMKLLEAL
jgi:hypothetical protein